MTKLRLFWWYAGPYCFEYEFDKTPVSYILHLLKGLLFMCNVVKCEAFQILKVDK